MGKRRSAGVLACKALACMVAATACASMAAADRAQLALRFYDDNAAARGSTLSSVAQREIERVAGVALVARGRNTDGAFLFDFAPPIASSDARSAANRLRATGALVYADLVDSRVTTKTSRASSSEPVTAVIVKFRSAHQQRSSADDTRERIAAKSGMAFARSRQLALDTQVLALTKPLDAASASELLARIASDPDVVHVEIDRRATPQLTPADPLFASQWNFTDPVGGINAPAAWDFTTGDPANPVAVLDSGLLPHPDLSGRVIGGYDFISEAAFAGDGDGRDADASDSGDYVTSSESSTPGTPLQGCPVVNSSWHGTMVAGTLGASVNNDGVSGVNWTNPLLNVRVLGKCGGALSDIADGIRWAAGLPVAGVPSNARPARVINLSFAGNGDCGPVLQAAVTDALAAGSVIVAAAGNDNDDVANHWPANCSGVIAVAATSKNASRAFYSNWGASIAVGAPGGGIGGSIVTLRNTGTTTADPAGYVYGSQVGSSLAAPHVAGIASLALAVDPALTPAEIRALIESTARPFPNVSTDACTNATCGAGIADAAAALASISAAPVTPGPRPPDALPPINLTPQPPSEKPAPPPPDASTTPPPGADDVGGTRRAKSREELDRILKD